MDGELITSDYNITQIMNTKIRKDEMKESNQGVELFLPSKKYTIENTGTDKEYTVKVFETDIHAEVKTEASKITMNLDALNKENLIIVHANSNEKYQINLKSMAEHDKENVVVQGIGTDGENVEVSREGNIGVVSGEDISYAITPDYGYMIKDVIVDGVSQGNISSKAVIKVPSSKKAVYKKLFNGKGQKKTVKIK